ncbi:MAG: thiosulfate oxidation carrier protein SoxY [Hyphomicrobiaceae bacterium]|nr:thiosulfate oxidation carrier protein SoxY [Hyphomicrobiaceae bacterium]
MTALAAGATRRNFLAATGGIVALAAVPSLALADDKMVADEIKKLFGDKPVKEGRIKLDLPSIAENGLVVPLSFDVESPMTAADYVKSVHFFAEGNPNPQVASFTFTPLAPKAAGSIRIRLAKTQNIIAVAEMSNGDVYKAVKEVKVTIGGCGG